MANQQEMFDDIREKEVNKINKAKQILDERLEKGVRTILIEEVMDMLK